MPQPLRTSGPTAIPIRAWNFGRAALPSYLFAKSKPGNGNRQHKKSARESGV